MVRSGVEKRLERDAEALPAVRDAFRDIHELVHSDTFSFDRQSSQLKYVSTLSAHIGSWGVPPRFASSIARSVFSLHRRVYDKVGSYLAGTYGEDYREYAHDFIKNALVRVYGDASAGLLEDFAKHPEKERAYVRALDSTAKAVQSNPGITDHVIREGYSIAPYAAELHRYRMISDLIGRALSRRYPRVVTDLRHTFDVLFASNHTRHYLQSLESTLSKMVSLYNPEGHGIPRRHLEVYSAALGPIAAHAALIDSNFSGSDLRAAREVLEFLYGSQWQKYRDKFVSLYRDPDLSPMLLGVAKYWDRGLNDRVLEAFHTYLKYGKKGLKDLVSTDGLMAWGDLWPPLSQTAHVAYPMKDDKYLVLMASKLNVADQLRALSRQPTCLYPANPQGQRWGMDYVLNTKNGDVMPVITFAKLVDPKKGRHEEIVGRLTMFADPHHGNIHIVSTPVGSVGLDKFVDLAVQYARNVNRTAGQNIFERVLVGGLGRRGTKFRIPVDDAYGDMIVQKNGVYYLRDPEIVRV